MLVPARAEGFDARVALVLDGDTFVAHVERGVLVVRREPARDVAVTITASPTALVAVAYGGESLTSAVTRGAMTIDGDRSAAKRFLSLYSLPPKVKVGAR